MKITRYKGKFVAKEIKLPQTPEDLENEAEIVGIMMGDGHIHSKQYSIRLKVRETDFIQNFSNLIEQTYHIEPIHKNPDYPTSYVHSKKLTRRLIKLSKNNKEIPTFIVQGTNKIKARFLRGFFDSEASMDIIYNRRQIVLTQNNLSLLNQIKKLLLDLKIQSRIYKKKRDSDKLIISLVENLIKYQKLIGFSIKYKEENLRNAINYLENCKIHNKEKYWQVLRHWLKSNKSMMASAKEMEMHWETYRTWIYGIRMPCQIKKDIEVGWIPKDYNDLKEQYEFLP